MNTRFVGTIFASAVLCATAMAADVGDGPCATAASKITIAQDSEPGPRMVVTGQVFKADGVTPAAGIIMYAYHTDAKGVYSEREINQAPARLQGWLKTDGQGRYEYRSIRPAQYPSNNAAAHVHYQFWGPGAPPQHAEELMFADDTKVNDAVRKRSASLGRFAFVKQGEVRGGVLYVTHDFRLKASGDSMGSVVHGLNACHVKH